MKVPCNSRVFAEEIEGVKTTAVNFLLLHPSTVSVDTARSVRPDGEVNSKRRQALRLPRQPDQYVSSTVGIARDYRFGRTRVPEPPVGLDHEVPADLGSNDRLPARLVASKSKSRMVSHAASAPIDTPRRKTRGTFTLPRDADSSVSHSSPPPC